MTLNFRCVGLCVLLAIAASGAARGENWPQWRGARHDGISHETDVPVKFSNDENLAWRLELPQRAGSTPVVWSDRIFLTSPSADDDALVLMCVSTAGKVMWTNEMGKHGIAIPRDRWQARLGLPGDGGAGMLRFRRR
jgi:hypothetical protein